MSVVSLSLERYPTADLLKLLANILTHIAQTNDRNPPVSIAASAPSPSTFTLTSAARTVLLPGGPVGPTSSYSTTACPTTTNTPLTFHARNVPTISLESYLLRILKYCPTSNFVFLSLLVYFDRMAALSLASSGGNYVHGAGCNGMTSGRRMFRVDSFNIHRLVIAGVTVASKFFSDVFYTNSRYAKVGGLPLPELNQLELQFLLLNDFRLVISPQQMHLYTQHLIKFSLENPPPSMGLEMSVLATSLGVGFGLNPAHSHPGFPDPPLPHPPAPPLVVNPRPSIKIKHKRTTTTPTTTMLLAPSSFSSPCTPPSPPLRPSSSPSPSPSNSSSSSLSSSPSASPRPPRMMTNGHLDHLYSISHPHALQVRHPKRPTPLNEEARDHNDSDSDDSDDEEEEDSDKGDADEDQETLTSTSTDDDSEPTIRGPRTVVGWEGDRGRESP